MGSGNTWEPTIVNPEGGKEAAGAFGACKFWFHIVVWVAALVLGSVTHFGAKHFMRVDADCTESCYTGISDTTFMIALFSGGSTILGVVLLVLAVSFWTTKEYMRNKVLQLSITSMTVYGCVGSFYIFSYYAIFTDTAMFWVSLFNVIVQSYAQLLLYSTSTALEVANVPRMLLPCIAASVQTISALAISSGDFKSASLITPVIPALPDSSGDFSGADSAPSLDDLGDLGNLLTTTTVHAEFSSAQKAIAWMVPISTAVAVVIMFVLRYSIAPLDSSHVTTPGGKPVGAFSVSKRSTELTKTPFLRSIVLACFMTSAVLGVYKLSFMTVDNKNPVAYMFALMGAVLNIIIVSLVMISSKAENAPPPMGVPVAAAAAAAAADDAPAPPEGALLSGTAEP